MPNLQTNLGQRRTQANACDDIIRTHSHTRLYRARPPIISRWPYLLVRASARMKSPRRYGGRVGWPVLSTITTSGPGSLSIRCGRDLLLGYERGSILIGQDIVFSAGPVRRALEVTARAAGLDDDDVVPDYVDTVRAIVREVVGHGRGGILIISLEKDPKVAAGSYKMTHDSSLVSLLRLARRIRQKKSHDQPLRRRQHDEAKTHSRSASESSNVDKLAFGSLLGNAFLIEAERVIERIGALSAIDGAILLNRALALIAFGVVLPLGRPTAVGEVTDAEGLNSRIIDLGSRGTRHRAAVAYAAEHPGSVVFVASEDGHVSCVFRHSREERTLLWRLDPAAVWAA